MEVFRLYVPAWDLNPGIPLRDSISGMKDHNNSVFRYSLRCVQSTTKPRSLIWNSVFLCLRTSHIFVLFFRLLHLVTPQQYIIPDEARAWRLKSAIVDEYVSSVEHPKPGPRQARPKGAPHA